MSAPVEASEYRRVLEEALRRLDSALREGIVELGGERVEVYGGAWISHLGEDAPLTVVGDLHGDHRSLDAILSRYRGSFTVFLGDYVDRGPPHGQVYAFYTVLRLFAEGEAVVPLRGNHEPPMNLTPYPHDYPLVLARLYGHGWEGLYELSRRVFDSLPHALLIPGRALLVHGGPPITTLASSRDHVEYLGGDMYPPPLGVLEEVLWSDPLPLELGEETVWNHVRGAGLLWGYRDTLRVLEKLGVKVIIRGHEWALDGYKYDHEGRVLTLFSRLGSPYPNRAAAVLHCEGFSVEAVERLVEGRGMECIHRIEP